MEAKGNQVTSPFRVKLITSCAVLGLIASIIFYYLVFKMFFGMIYVSLMVAMLLPGWGSKEVPGLPFHQFQWIPVLFMISGGLGGLIAGYVSCKRGYNLRNGFISSAVGGIIFSLLPIIVFIYIIFTTDFRYLIEYLESLN